MRVDTYTTIEVSSVAPGDPVRRRTAELLKYPTLNECRESEGRDEPLEFGWQLPGHDPVTTPFRVDVVGGDGIQTFVHGRTGPRSSRYSMRVLATYNGETPAAFSYLEWLNR